MQAILRPGHDKTGPGQTRSFSGLTPAPDAVRVAIIGSGATGIYALKTLLESPAPLEIHIFEREREIGTGMPYRTGVNLPQMLSNIGSREVPPVTETLEDYLRACDDATLRDFGVARSDIGPEEFYPRIVLGRYFMAQIAALIARARGAGHSVEVRARHAVRDIRPGHDGIRVEFETPHAAGEDLFAHVVLATGHQWKTREDASGVVLHAPWPAEALRRFTGQTLGILGSSLTAIDTAVALASFHGRFEEGETVEWIPNDPADRFHMTMLSRRGLLPDADWYYPLPLPPLDTFNDGISRDLDRPDLLAHCQSLLAQDLKDLDPDYASRTRPDELAGFARRHFADRLKMGGWAAARDNLERAARNRAARHTDPWRMALLSAHEVYEIVLPHLSDKERALFDRELRPVFADVYASVPHRSIRRMLALHDAGVLDLHGLGDGYAIEAEGSGARVTGAMQSVRVDALIDARGQPAADIRDLMFPTLADTGRFDPDTLLVTCPGGGTGTVTCVSIPVLLQHNPFVQGLENVESLGRRAGENVLHHARAPTAA